MGITAEPDWTELRRLCGFESHRLVGWIYWDPTAIANYAALGVPDGLGYYIATRAAPLAAGGDGATLDVPGTPRVILAPGHTAGSAVFHFAGHDDHIPPHAVQRVHDAMAGRSAEVHVYAGASHGFNCWARDSYHPASAALAHGRATAFLAASLF